MGKVEKLILLVGMIFSLLLTLPNTVYSKDIVSEDNVFISSPDNLTIVSTDAYEFRFNNDSLYWNVTRKGPMESFLKYARWRLYFNATSLGAESDEYNSTNGGRYWSSSAFEGGIFLNFTSASKGKAPTVMEYFWFYPRYFVIQLNVTHKISARVIRIEKAQYVDGADSSVKIGDYSNTNFVFWGYRRRYQAQDVADAEPPVFVYSNKTDEGLVIAPFKPNWTHHVMASYMAGSDFRFLYGMRAETTTADAITIAENNWVAFDKVFFQFTSADINQAFKDYTSLYSTMYTLRPYKGSQTYWLSWYAGNGELGENVTEDNVMSNATWIKNNLKTYYGFDGVLIDAIITDEVGDWLNYSKTRFSSGMSAVVDKIHAMGLKIGLWIAPLMVEKDGWINLTHPESIAKNKAGQLLFSQLRFSQVKHDVYYLNPFDPWVQNRLRWVNQNISAWGFDFVKMDFLSGPLYEIYEENKTQYMVMEQTFKAVTAGLDDRIVVTALAGEFYNPALVVNYVDRIWVYGLDLWAYSPSQQIQWGNLIRKYDALTNLIPFIKHFNLTVDSDALGRLSTDPPVPFSLAKFYSTYATVGGGTFEIGERFSTVDHDTLEFYKKHLPFVSDKWCPVEWDSISRTRPPRVWLYNTTIDGRQHYYVALFNPENTSKTITIDLLNQLKLPTGTYLAMNQYNSSFLGESASFIDIDLGANETMIMTLAQKTWEPTFLMRSDHIAASVSFVSTIFSGGKLTIMFSRYSGTLTSTIVFSPQEPLYVLQNDSHIIRLPDKNSFESNPEPNWYYDSILKLLFIKAQQSSFTTIVASYIDDLPPTIWEVRRLLEQPEYDRNVTVVANITDIYSSLETAILSYYDGSTWHNLTMLRNLNGLYEAEIPANPYGALIEYKVYTNDTWGNSAISEKESYVVIDHTPPDVGIPNHVPAEPIENQEVNVSVRVSEPPSASGIRNATLWFKTDSQWHSINMKIENETATTQIPGERSDTFVEFFIEVFDNAGNHVITPTYGYAIEASGAWPLTVLTPWVIAGCIIVLLIGTYCCYWLKKKLRNYASVTPFEKRRACDEKLSYSVMTTPKGFASARNS